MQKKHLGCQRWNQLVPVSCANTFGSLFPPPRRVSLLFAAHLKNIISSFKFKLFGIDEKKKNEVNKAE